MKRATIRKSKLSKPDPNRDPNRGRGWLVVVALAGCGRDAPRVEAELPAHAIADRAPIVFVPGISREVAAVLRGGGLIRLSALALRMDAEALANLGDPRFPADGMSAVEAPAMLDRPLRLRDVRWLQGLIDHLVREEGYVQGDPDDLRDKDYPENPAVDRKDRTRAASLFVVYY